jgi:hypothetical protein
METQPVAQGKGPKLTVIRDGVALDQLRMRLVLAVETVQLIQTMVAWVRVT